MLVRIKWDENKHLKIKNNANHTEKGEDKRNWELTWHSWGRLMQVSWNNDKPESRS